MLRPPRLLMTLLVALCTALGTALFAGSALAVAPAAAARPAATKPKPGSSSRTAPTTSTAPPTPKAYVLADADSGVILAAGGAHTPLPPASTVKIMTGLTALRRLLPDTAVTVSARAAAQPAMKIGMHEGEVWPLNDVVHTLYMVSANDSAYALAEAAGGTVENFAAQMNDTAQRLGMRDSVFNDPAGLDDAAAVNGGSRMSAFDLAIAARNALAVPQIADVVKLVDYKFTGPDGVPHTLHNHNATFLKQYAGATGMKTGYTDKAGRGLVCTATRGNRTMIGVVLDIYDNAGTCGRLLDQGFSSKPNAVGTGEKLPGVKIFTAVARQNALAGLPRSLGRPALSEITGPTTTASAVPAAVAAAPRTTATAKQTVARNKAHGTKRASTHASTSASSSASWFSPLKVTVAVVAILALLFVARRRAVKRRRKVRIARQKALAEARRRGMLHVLGDDAVPGSSHVSVLPRRQTG